ncbi:S1C family serine protease [bacterium]|nr:S1C family serine protease [bacterium]
MKKIDFLWYLILILAVSMISAFFVSTKVYNEQWAEMMMDVSQVLNEKRYYLLNDEQKTDLSLVNQSLVTDLSNKVWLIAQKNVKNSSNILDNIYFEDNFIGSAIVATNDGWLITSSDIEKLNNLVIINDDNQIIEVQEIINDSILGINYIKINQSNLEPIAIADSQSLEVGQKIYAVKPNLYNYQNELISNSIRNLHSRFITQKIDLIHYSEDIVIYGLLNTNLGDNLALINAQGQFIGFSIENKGKSYFIPSKYIRYSLTKLFINDKNINYPSLGISYLDLSEIVLNQDMSELSLGMGALVYSIDESEDFLKNDIITYINQDKINEIRSLNTLLLDYKIGDEVLVTFIRDNQELQKKVFIQSLFPEMEYSTNE